jgi:xanthine/uracil permease
MASILSVTALSCLGFLFVIDILMLQKRQFMLDHFTPEKIQATRLALCVAFAVSFLSLFRTAEFNRHSVLFGLPLFVLGIFGFVWAGVRGRKTFGSGYRLPHPDYPKPSAFIMTHLAEKSMLMIILSLFVAVRPTGELCSLCGVWSALCLMRILVDQ